jgi:predicted enzyme related to lactoylglutathione lyase
MPVLDCTDMARSLTFYTDKLGFDASTFGEPATFAILQRGTVTLGLSLRAVGQAAIGQTWAAYIYVANSDAVHAEWVARGVDIADAPEDRFYNCRDFTVDDPDGNQLGIGHTLDADPLGPGLSQRIGRVAAPVTSSQRSARGPWSGGCQCGRIRFRVEKLGRASFCHCRMCQKAFGATGGALVTAHEPHWTRGELSYFQSSRDIRRGFCSACGTPLTFEYDDTVDIAIAAFDRAAEIAPVIQYSPEAALPWAASVPMLPGYPPEEHERRQAWFAAIRSNQHPDYDTDQWPLAERR